MKMQVGKKARVANGKQRRILPVLVAAASMACGVALANPSGPQVIAGQASMDQQGHVLTITNSPNAIIDWQSFSIGANETMRFVQQSQDSAVLNRVVGQDPSQILGALQSNGRVFLINPNGIVFGEGARVDVNGLVASTLGLDNADFLAGNLDFKAAADAGALSNRGAITTPRGGQVYLIAPHIENGGIITSPQGDVLLAAGQSVQLLDSASPDLRVVISAPGDQAINLGQVIAQGGSIGIYAALINQRGVVNANSAVVGENGRVILKASRDTLLEAGSATSATGAGSGGEIQILGERIGLTGDARVDASGQDGGGTVLLGGDYQGGNAAIPNAQTTYVGRETLIAANALRSGDGGKIVIWSDQATRAYGRISARGGATAGDGGLVETSGHYLDVAGIEVDAGATNGRLGAWYLDPYDIEVVTGGTGTLADVDLFAAPPASGITTIDPSLISGALANVTLQATHDITFSSAVDITAADVGLTARAGNDLRVNNWITSNGGAIALFANDAGGPASGTGLLFTEGRVTSNGGDIALSGYAINAGSLFSGGGAIDVESDSNIALVGTLDAGAGNVTLLAGARIDAIVPIPIVANTLQMTAVGGITDGNGGPILTQVAALNAANSGAGDIIIANSTGNLSIVDLGSGHGIQQSGGGIVDLSSYGVINGSGRVSADSLDLHAEGGIALQTSVSALSAINYGSGDINIVNAAPLALGRVAQLAEVGTNGGAILIETSGAMTVTDNVSTDSGSISLTAHSPLTVDGSVVSNSGDISLLAGASGVPDSGDTLTINGSVTSISGNIALGAGDAIVVDAGAVVSTGGVVTRTEHLNVPPLPTLEQCINNPTAPGCESVLPTLGECTTTPTLAGCAVVLPSLVTCIANAATAGCNVVLPSLATCIANPATAGCAVVLPGLATCTANPATTGCSVVLPSLTTCIAVPTTTGCTAVLPSLVACTVNPATAGCSVVLPTLATCVANPSTAGCMVVLPSLVTCIASPATAGCTVVLPTLSQCTAMPTLVGCAVVLPSLATCTATPAAPGCSVVLPTLAACVANPSTAGCMVVLPSLATCTANPVTAGCSVVLPTLSQCTATPTLAGCAVVLPSLATCTATPTVAGCSVVFPTLATCVANPSTAGCMVVLPSLATCTANPATAGCSVVLPTLATCVANPSAPGCTVVLPGLATCTANPGMPGCSAVLPTLAQCTASPTLQGCAAVLPPVNSCIANPTAPGCLVVVPPLQSLAPTSPVAQAINCTVAIINSEPASAPDKVDTTPVLSDKSSAQLAKSEKNEQIKKTYCN